MEKVIKGLECCTRYEVGKQLNNCLDCPYVEPIGFNQFRCKSQEMKEDALALLKEQPEIVRCKDCKWWDKKDGANYGYCHACKHGYYSDHWEIGIYRTYKGDFFCSDGERKEGR